MIRKDGVLKLLNFSVSREEMGYTNQYLDSEIGTNSYKAPELFGPVPDDQNFSLVNYWVDLWALGVVLHYLI